jgi:HlyD family secretion protein
MAATTEVGNVYFEVGDEVKKGDLIVSFDNAEAMREYKSAAIAYEKTRLGLDETERKYFETMEDIAEIEDNMEFHKKKMEEYEDSTDPDERALFERYQAKYENAKSRKEGLEDTIPSEEQLKIDQLSFEEAKMKFEEAQEKVNSLPGNIIAGQDGTIEELNAKKLNTISKGTVAVAIKTSETQTVEMSVGKYDIVKVALGQSAEITLGNKTYQGTVTEIGTAADEKSNVKVKIQVDNPDESFIPGMEVDVDVLTYSTPSALALPVEAVKTDRGGDYCYTAELTDPEKQIYQPVKTYITLGNSSDQYIEVTSGLTEGQLVIDNPPTNIDSILACIISQPA